MRKIAGTGWVKLYRDIQQHWIFTDPVKLKIWIALLTRASHKKIKINVGYHLVELSPGQLVFGLNKFSTEINIERSKLYRIIKMMAADRMIEYDTESYSNFSIVTIVKWQQYQSEIPSNLTLQEKEQSPEIALKQKGNFKKTVVKTNNNEKNEKNGKKYKEMMEGIDPAQEIERIYNSLNSSWRGLFKSYIKIYCLKNKSGKITDNRHYHLLLELYQIFSKLEFSFDGKSYQLSENIFQYGINQIIDREIDNLNYAKKIWLNSLKRKKGETDDRVSKTSRGKETGDSGQGKFSKKIPDYNKRIKWG